MARSRSSPRRTLALPFCLVLIGCGSETPWVCEVPEPEGPVVRVSAEEVAEVERWGAVELWSAGGLEAGGAQLMMPTSARVRADGTLAVADFASGDVWLLDREGRWMEPVAGRGEGPGELLSPLATAWTSAGELLALDASQSRVERFDLESGASETLRLPPDLLGPIFASGEVGWFGMRGDGTVFVELPSSASEDATVTYVRAAPGDAERSVIWEAEYLEGPLPAYDRPTRPEWPRAALAVGVDRWAVAPRSDRYEVIVYGPRDEVDVHICVSDRERFGPGGAGGEVDAGVRPAADGLPRSETEALFSRIRLDHDGRLWIERELPGLDSPSDRVHGVAGAHLDVVSPDGELLARMQLPDGLRFQEARGDTLWAFRIGEFDEIEVVAARITRSAR
ncbi:MAG: hypothetical protein RQ745_07805 [Longimicrobiales bacterium]|nr:hypothetical protein [Longimicrobiales bacterium]